MEYEEVSGDKAPVWRHFIRAKDKKSAKCKICSKILKCVGGSTSGLHKHFKNIHHEEVEKNPPLTSKTPSQNLDSDVSLPSTSKRAKLSDYFESEEYPSTATRISRMVALDGITFHTLANSTDIRQVFNKTGNNIPKSKNSIREVVLQHHKEKQDELKKELSKLKSENEKFSISFDEWSSNKNRRYISLNLHSPSLSGPFKFKNLGLIRVYGSLPAKKFIEQIRQKLEIFGVDLETDIIAETTDGCSVMVKIGKLLSKSLHQLCIAHGIQLALSDVFYKKPTSTYSAVEAEAIAPNESDLYDFEDEITLAELVRRGGINTDIFLLESSNVDVDTEHDFDDDDGVLFYEEIRNYENELDQSSLIYFDLISKVRTVVKLFKKSPTKNDDILQKHVLADFGKEYSLLLDAKTRWSSMADMLARFVKLKLSINKALLDLNSNITFSQEEWKTLHELNEILDTIKTIVESLSRRNASLLTADIAIKFAMRKLTEMNTTISKQMRDSLKKRYSERRLVEASTLYYLTNPKQYFEDINNEDMETFPRLTSDEMCRNIIKLISKPSSEHDSVIEDEIQTDEENVPLPPPMSKSEELNQELKKVTTMQSTTRQQENDLDDFEKVKIEMVLFENGGDRGKNLTLALRYLSAIPPTSVEPERIFSSAGYICNRLRTSLSDRTIDAISFLRTYYQEKRCK